MRARRSLEVWLQDLFARLVHLHGGYRLGSLLFRVLGRGPLFPTAFYRGARKLNLGCSDRPVPGWVNVDVRRVAGISVVADVRALPFRDGAFDLVRGSHVLEHFHTWDVPGALREWARVLRPRGWMMVCVPDFDWVVRQYRKDPSVLSVKGDPRDAAVLISLYGESFHTPKPWYEHWMIYNFESLGGLLRAHGGLEAIRIFNYWQEEPCTLGCYDASMEPWSLNMAARKPAARIAARTDAPPAEAHAPREMVS
jgi:predicted SAM-dependent methyltransferase